MDRIAHYADIARSFAASILRIVIDDEGYKPTVDRIISILKESHDSIEGMRLAIENHDRFPASTLRHIIESVASDRVRICLDTANSLGAGEGLETVLRELGHYTVNLHIKDFSIQRVPTKMGFSVEGTPAGSGMLDIPSLVRTFDAYPGCETSLAKQILRTYLHFILNVNKVACVNPLTRGLEVDMSDKLARDLAPREQQIMAVVYQLRSASVAHVRAGLEVPPSYSAVRTMTDVTDSKTKPQSG